jgi:hypothetical protein
MLPHSHALFFVAVFIISILVLRVLEQIICQLRREDENQHARRRLVLTPAEYHRPRPMLARHGQRGQVLIECLILMPLLFFCFLACMDVAVALEDLGALSHAAQQTAICTAAGLCPDAVQFAKGQVQGIGFMDPAKLSVAVTCSTPAICNAAIQYKFAPLGPWVTPLVLTRTATAVKAAS